MTDVLILRFLIILVAMLVAGVFGYMLARHRMRQDTDMQLSMMSAEILKMRRRAGAAEADAVSAQARLARDRRKQRRRA